MKRSSIISGIVVVAVMILAAVVVSQLYGVTPVNAHMDHRQAWHDAARYEHRGMPMLMKPDNRAVPNANPVWPTLLQLAALIGGAMVFAKASGILRWTGAVFAAFSAMSLLTPFWGLVVVILVYLLYRRITNHHKYIAPQEFTGYDSPIEIGENRGRFLDEWERNQYKED